MGNNKDYGYIKVYRSFFRHKFWQEKRTFSRAEAWLDLFASANYTAQQEYIGNVSVIVDRGEFVASIRFLCQRWGWSTTKVSTFLTCLKEQKSIAIRTAPGTQQSIISILNYESYNKDPHEQDTEKDSINDGEITAEATAEMTPTASLTYCNNEKYEQGDENKRHPERHPAGQQKDTIQDTKKDEYKERNKERINERKDNIHKQVFKVIPENAGAHERECACESAHDPPKDVQFRKTAAALLRWMTTSTPHLLAMEEPLQIDDALLLVKNFTKEDIGRVLTAMNNKRGIETKYVNTLATFRQWANLDHILIRKRKLHRELNENKRYNAENRDAIMRGYIEMKREKL